MLSLDLEIVSLSEADCDASTPYDITHHKPSHGVVHVHFPVGHGEEQQPGVLRPAHAGQVNSGELLAPNAIAVDAPDDDGAVLVHNADLLAVRIPRHPPHDGLVPVVDHLFVPTP